MICKSQCVPNKKLELELELDNILSILRKLKTNKAPGMDNLHPRFLKELSQSLLLPLQIIFSLSLSTCKVPSDWKKGQIRAIFKKGNNSLAGNYRPVSLTSIASKILETIVRDHIMSYMFKNSLFSDGKYGFLPRRSTSLQLLNVIDKWTEAIDKGHTIDCIYMDYEKAFDTVPHKRLISKLKSYNFHSSIVTWVKDFLTGRSQQVKVNNKMSKWVEVTSGIPQGSVLGPILFVIVINDMPDSVKSSIYLFADETKIFNTISSTDSA